MHILGMEAATGQGSADNTMGPSKGKEKIAPSGSATDALSFGPTPKVGS
jgi:hypothetical protein